MKRLLTVAVFCLLSLSLIAPAGAWAHVAVPDGKSRAADNGIYIATVKVDKLNVRRIPSTKGSVRGVLVRDEQITLVGRDMGTAWVEAETDFGKGWLDARYISVNLDISGLPVTEGFIAPFAVVEANPRGFVHAGPFEEYPVIAKIPFGNELDVVGLHTLNTWVEVVLPDGETHGWISLKLVKVFGDVNDLPTTDKSVLPMARVNTFRLRVRAEPDISSEVITVVRMGELYTIDEQTTSELWYHIVGDFGEGWVQSSFVKVVGVLDPLYR